MTTLTTPPLSQAKFTKQQFIDWLERQPPDRQFSNGCGYLCVGHAFLSEALGDEGTLLKGRKHHNFLDINRLSEGGWFGAEFPSFCVHRTAMGILTALKEVA